MHKKLTARRIKDKAFVILCCASTVLGVILLGILMYSVFSDGADRLNLKFLTEFPSRFPHKSGIKSALYGSIWLVVLTAIISVPVGVCAAIYLEEFNTKRNRLTEFIQLNITNLAGVPSIVYGLLGLAVFVRFLSLERSIIAGALTMTLLILPMLITVSQEALRAVPRSYREGSFALGATEWQTIYRQVIPSAASAILTGIILSLSRAMGETAPLIVVGAVAYVARVPQKLTDQFTVLPIQIFNWTSEAKKGFHDAAAAAIIVLLIVLLTLNSIAIFLRYRSRKA